MGVDSILIMIYTQLMEINRILFYFINHNLQNSFFDFLMPIITNLGALPTVLAICLIILIYGIMKKNKRIIHLAIIGLIGLAFTDSIISAIKIIVAEPRPFVNLNNVHLLVGENDSFSFPSGHSGNIFAIATVLGLSWSFKIKNNSIKLVWLLIPMATVVGFSRIYVGVHYPFDVLVGSIIGIIMGIIAIKIGKNYLFIDKNLKD